MATIQDRVRTKLASKLFGKLGKTVTFIKKSSPLYNSRGEKESVTSVSSTITVVPYDITTKSLEYESFGSVETGEMAVAIPYTVSVAINDILVIEGANWEIKEILDNYLPGNVVTIARISRVFA